MSVVFALLTSDSNLLRCELARLKGDVSLQVDRANAVGVGTHVQEDVLLQRLSETRPLHVESIAPHPESETLLFHARRLPAGGSPEEDAQPFRARRWLFAHQGVLEGHAEVRDLVKAQLPEFLRRQLQGGSDSALAFAVFLKHLRETGRTEDRRLDPLLAGRMLALAAGELARVSAASGTAHRSTLNLVATNGELLAFTRWGDLPLYFRQLEGTETCERCNVHPGTPETNPLVAAHRRHRSFAVASALLPGAHGWVELAHGRTIAVGPDLNVHGPF